MSQTTQSPSTETHLRLKEIDFLRGIAVILVLFRHHWLTDTMQNLGWIGVDLFFVLSGFLVSGLLFTEYKRFDNIRPLYFLIRRGFKIYPLFYTSLIITVIYYVFFVTTTLNYKGQLVLFLSEAFFLQNYVTYFWAHHWSLAVEEHFYIFLSVLLFILAKLRVLPNQKIFFTVAFFIFAASLGMRIVSNLQSNDAWRNFGATHLRIDSLFAGVVVGYLFHFSNERLRLLYEDYKLYLFLFVAVPFTFAPFVEPLDSLFVRTIGFSLLYLSFSAILIIFLFNRRVTEILSKILTRSGYLAICKIGFYSYSIYLFHFYLIKFVVGDAYLAEHGNKEISVQVVVSFILYSAGSILLGIITSKLIEIPFLKVRDKYFPRRAEN